MQARRDRRLVAQSGHRAAAGACPLQPRKRASALRQALPAREPDRTCRTGSLDDLVDTDQDRIGDDETQRFRGSQVQDKIELRRLLDRHLGRLGAVEDANGIDTNLAKTADSAGPLAHEAASLDKLLQRKQYGHRIAGRHAYKQIVSAVEKRIDSDSQRGDLLFRKCRKRRFQFAFVACT